MYVTRSNKWTSVHISIYTVYILAIYKSIKFPTSPGPKISSLTPPTNKQKHPSGKAFRTCLAWQGANCGFSEFQMQFLLDMCPLTSTRDGKKKATTETASFSEFLKYTVLDYNVFFQRLPKCNWCSSVLKARESQKKAEDFAESGTMLHQHPWYLQR